MGFKEKFSKFARSLIAIKTLASLQHQNESSKLKRALGPVELVAIGIGGIIGTGIFVLTGIAAAQHSGPAVVLSFVIAGITATFAALSYAELASMIPIAGSAYTYTYATMGELVAWIIGWDLILEYLIGSATVSVGWSRYTISFLEDVFSTHFSTKFTRAPIFFNETTHDFHVTGDWFNLPAVLIVLFITLLLMHGIKDSVRVNAAAVVIKLFVILLFIGACAPKINFDNYHPFVPENRGGSAFGLHGIFTGSTMVFFAYIGFDAVSTAAQEAKNPQRDMPIGILVSLVICTALYIAVSFVLTGIAHYSTLNTAAPLTDAIRNNLGWRWLTIIIEVGAIAGLTSVMLIGLMGQPRIFYAMATDGLFPDWMAKVHPKYKTPYVTTLITGLLCALAGGLLPIDVLGEMTSIGTLFAFVLANIGVLILRYTQPDAPRRFKIPGGVVGGYAIPGIGAVLSACLIFTANLASIERLFAWMAIGIVIYFCYGYHHSRIRYPDRKRPAEDVHEMHGADNRGATVTAAEDGDIRHIEENEKNEKNGTRAKDHAWNRAAVQ